MATITVVISSKVKKNGCSVIYIRIRDVHKKKDINTGFKVPQKYFKNGEVKATYPDAAIINSKIYEQVAEIKTKYLQYGAIEKKKNIVEYLSERILFYKELGMKGYASNILSVIEAINNECPNLYFNELRHSHLDKFKLFWIKKGNKVNTIAKKFNVLSTAINYAKKDRLYFGENIVSDYKYNTEKVSKEKLNFSEIELIEKLDLSNYRDFDKTRDLFLFSYYCKGMRFENCYMVRNEDIVDGRVYFYKISKSNKPVSVKIHQKLQAIIDKYYDANKEYLFKTRLEHESYNTICNRNLKVIAQLCGINKNLTFHISRHSFANNMKSSKQDVYVIQQALGHSDVRTTQMYLAALEDDIIDKEIDDFYNR